MSSMSIVHQFQVHVNKYRIKYSRQLHLQKKVFIWQAKLSKYFCVLHSSILTETNKSNVMTTTMKPAESFTKPLVLTELQTALHQSYCMKKHI